MPLSHLALNTRRIAVLHSHHGNATFLLQNHACSPNLLLLLAFCLPLVISLESFSRRHWDVAFGALGLRSHFGVIVKLLLLLPSQVLKAAQRAAYLVPLQGCAEGIAKAQLLQTRGHKHHLSSVTPKGCDMHTDWKKTHFGNNLSNSALLTQNENTSICYEIKGKPCWNGFI